MNARQRPRLAKVNDDMILLANRFTSPSAPPFRDGALRLSILALLCLVALTGCGYSHGGSFPKDVSSIAVPIFENRTPYRDVEFALAEALVKEIELRTPYKVVRTADADTILAGVVTQVDQRVLSRRAVGGLAQEMEISIIVSFEWKNQRTGDSLRDRKGFVTVGRHVPARPVGEPFEIARHEAVQQMAKDIVSVMRENW